VISLESDVEIIHTNGAASREQCKKKIIKPMLLK